MELLCIETHPEKVVVAGSVYKLINDKPRCACDVINVGVKHNKISLLIYCGACNKELVDDGYWWVRRNRFIPIGTTDEIDQYESHQVESL